MFVSPFRLHGLGCEKAKGSGNGQGAVCTNVLNPGMMSVSTFFLMMRTVPQSMERTSRGDLASAFLAASVFIRLIMAHSLG